MKGSTSQSGQNFYGCRQWVTFPRQEEWSEHLNGNSEFTNTTRNAIETTIFQ